MNKSLIFLFAFCAAYFSCWQTKAGQNESGFVIKNSDFPSVTRVYENSSGRYFEFCPDNTCDVIKTPKYFDEKFLMELGFVYLFYISDYYVLENWRANQSTQIYARELISKMKAVGCSTGFDKRSAVCILKKMIKNNGLKIYEVRYDENARHVVNKKIP